MDSPLRVGMIGVGNFGSYRREKMKETGLFDLVAAFDIDGGNLAACVAEEGCRAATSYEALLSSGDIEAVIIATGAMFHAEQAIAALDHGLHVFVEKPLCSTAGEIIALSRKQTETGLVVGVGHKDLAGSPKMTWLKGLLAGGEMGSVATFEAVTAHSGGLVIKPGEWRGVKNRNPGGMLFQCGVHVFHELAYLFGPLKRIAAFMNYGLHDTETADITQCVLEFESGLIGTLGAYHVTPYRHSLTVYGTDKILYLDERSYGEPSVHLSQTRNGGFQEPRMTLEVPEDIDGVGNLINFYRAVRYRETPSPGLMDGIMPVAACLAAVDSARTGRAVDMNSFYQEVLACPRNS